MLKESFKKRINELIKKKMTIKNIIEIINKENQVPKKLIYNYYLDIKNEKK